MSANQQVGNAQINGTNRAALWSGSAESFVDLHPAGATISSLHGTSGSQQVGGAILGGTTQAGLWSGTAASFVSLHPPGATASDAYAISGSFQVGNAEIGGTTHAAFWTGTAQSFLDLHTVLGTNYHSSQAFGAWSDGAVLYVAGSAAINFSSGFPHAILWKIVTSPSLKVADARMQGGANVLTLTWPISPFSVVLESAQTPNGNWNPVANPWLTNAGWVFTTLTNTAAAQFYRLTSR
jgi:hypothetical protein